jgi:SSS family solute:Na+ symporter
MLSIWGTPELMLTFALSIVLSTVFCQGINQQLLQPAMSARSEHSVRKALWIAAPVNGFFGVFMICIGLAAKASPESNSLGPKMAGTALLLGSLPPWLVAWIFATLLAAVLSSYAMASMACATMFTMDIYKNFFNPAADERLARKVTRIALLILAITAVFVAAYLPPIVAAMNWLFAWLTPVFWMVIFGLFWKRSAKAAVWTFAVTWMLNMLWSFTSIPALLSLETLPNVYITLASSFIVGITALKLSDGEPGLFRDSRGGPAGGQYSPRLHN